MKQYFAKWLPVEGPIKKNDKYIITKSLGLGRYNNGYIGTAAIDFTEKAQEEQGAKKLKLFLCSRSIQVGDKFTQVGIDMIHPTARFTCTKRIEKDGDISVYDDEDRLFFVHNKDYPDKVLCYKIIGEISTEAKWVKEGDEFDEYQLLEAMIKVRLLKQSTNS